MTSIPLGAPGQEVELDAALREVVEHLVGGATFAARHREQLFHVGHVEVRDAPAADAALRHERLERLDGLRERRGPAPVKQVEIEGGHAEALQRRDAGRAQLSRRGVVGIELAHHEGVAPAGDGLADDALGTTLAIHLGGIDHGHAEVEPGTQRVNLGRARRVLSHVPCAHSQARQQLKAGIHVGREVIRMGTALPPIIP